MRFKNAFLAVLFCSLIFSLNTHAYGEKGVELILSFDKSEYKKQDPILFDLVLKNNSQKSTYVNSRFYINSKKSEKSYREVYLTVYTSEGKEIEYTGRDRQSGYPKSDYFFLLEPGKDLKMERQGNLKNYFDISSSGAYSIVATYENSYGKEIGMETFKDKVDSNKVTINITEQ